MAGGDAGATLRLRHAPEERVAQRPCARFQICAGSKGRDLFDDARNAELSGNQLGAVLVPVGFVTAQAMVQVGGAHRDAEACGQLSERGEQRDGIRSPGQRHEETFAGLRQMVPQHRAADLIEERFRPASLHSNVDFDIIAAALQMVNDLRTAPPRRMARVTLALVFVLCPMAAHADDGPTTPPAADPTEPGMPRQEILQTLHDVQRQYGGDAVLLEGRLLGQAIRSGSILEATIAVSGIEELGGKRFVTFRLQTGIIYNDRSGRDATAAGRAAHLWSDIVEVSLRQFRTLVVPADGIAVLLEYAHKPYADESDLRSHLNEGRGEPETAAVYLLLPDITALTDNHVTAQQLLDRSVVLIDGKPVHLVVQ